jgi:hypothetical protein
LLKSPSDDIHRGKKMIVGRDMVKFCFCSNRIEAVSQAEVVLDAPEGIEAKIDRLAKRILVLVLTTNDTLRIRSASAAILWK